MKAFTSILLVLLVITMIMAKRAGGQSIPPSLHLLGGTLLGVAEGRGTHSEEYPFVYPMTSLVAGPNGLAIPNSNCTATAVGSCLLTANHCFQSDAVKAFIHVSGKKMVEIYLSTVERIQGQYYHPLSGFDIAIAKLESNTPYSVSGDVFTRQPLELPTFSIPNLQDYIWNGVSLKPFLDRLNDARSGKIVGYKLQHQGKEEMERFYRQEPTPKGVEQMLETLGTHLRQLEGTVGIFNSVSNLMSNEERNEMKIRSEKLRKTIDEMKQNSVDSETVSRAELYLNMVRERDNFMLNSQALLTIAKPSFSEPGDSGGPVFVSVEGKMKIAAVISGGANNQLKGMGTVAPIALHYQHLMGAFEKLSCFK